MIVHIAREGDLEELVEHIPRTAWELARRFWPGPLTMVLKKKQVVPPEVTAGLDTVAVRMPLHPAALALIEEAGLPIAAPSANLSGRPSPTTALHVLEDLQGKIDALIDGGPCVVGLESTVLDLTREKPRLLRPGGVTLEDLQEVLEGKEIQVCTAPGKGEEALGGQEQPPPSPGLKYQHYAPEVPMYLVEGEPSRVREKIINLCQENRLQGKKVGVLVTAENAANLQAEAVEIMGSRQAPQEIAASFFNSLRRLDASGVDLILAESLEEKGLGRALMNRLRKAASGKTIRAG